MTYKYTLTKTWVEKLVMMEEFANGGMQVTVRLRDGRVFEGVLISACAHIVAIRGHRDLPFSVEEIAEIYQTSDDRNPKQRGPWDWWDLRHEAPRQGHVSGRLGAFVIGTIFGAILGLIALWGFQLNGREGVIAVVCIAFPFGLIAAFWCPKKFEKAVAYFLTITNP